MKSGMISKIFISTVKGEIIVSENCRINDATDSAEEYFISLVKKEKRLSPHMEKDGYSFHYILHDGLYFVAIAKIRMANTSNLYTLQCTELLVRFYTLCKDLCGIVSRESISANSTSIQELLMDFMDFGYPQLIKADKLKPHLYSKPVIFKEPPLNAPTSGLMATALTMPQDALSLFGEHKNACEIFLDIIEELSVLVDKEGRLLHAEVAGNVYLKCFMKDKQNIRIAFNKDLKIVSGEKSAGTPGQAVLDSCNFNENVNVDAFAKERVVSINPQCGNVFSVCTYNIRQSFGIPIPFRLLYTITEGHQSKDLELNLVLRCELPYNTQALNVVGILPVPSSTSGVVSALSGQVQSMEHISATSLVIWKIKSFPGATEAVAKLKLVEGNCGIGNRLALGPLALTFELSGLAISGLKIRYLHMDSKTVEKPVTWIRYITMGNSYMLRLS